MWVHGHSGSQPGHRLGLGGLTRLERTLCTLACTSLGLCLGLGSSQQYADCTFGS